MDPPTPGTGIGNDCGDKDADRVKHHQPLCSIMHPVKLRLENGEKRRSKQIRSEMLYACSRRLFQGRKTSGLGGSIVAPLPAWHRF